MNAGRGFGAKALLVLGVLVLGLSGGTAPVGAQESADLDKSGFVDANDLLRFQEQWHTGGAFDPAIPPNAQVVANIVGVTIPGDNRPEVEFTLQDGNGNPIAPSALNTIRFAIARIKEGDVQGKPLYTHYENYITRTVMNQVGSATPGTVTARQATYDAGNAADVSMLGSGNLLYKFRNAINIQPSDLGLTHTVGAQIDYRVGENRSIANPLFNFVPNGGPVTTIRELSDTISCNVCHDRLAIHGGGRQEFGLCILCHNPATDNIDPDSGNTIDMANMIHKIHRGANLSQPYMIYGNQNSLHDYSHVVFPQDIRNCDVCHTGDVSKGTGAQADQYLSTPSRRTCGSCHDSVNFGSGAGHGPGIPQADDTLCSSCHANIGTEFDMSVPGAHTVPVKSTQIAGLNAEILEVQNAAAGSAPLVRFRLFENDNDPITIGSLNRVAISVAGPTVDYATQWTEVANAGNTVQEAAGTYAYQMTRAIGSAAQGTYAFGLEARGNTFQIKPGDPKSSVRESAFNPVVYVDLATKGTVEPRRLSVDLNKCNNCHDLLTLHGTLRKNYEYCVFCHRPGETDRGVRHIAASANPSVPATPETINFKDMIHKIHAGDQLSKDYTVIGFGGSVHNYNEVVFPGRIQNCEMCHVPDGQAIPTPQGALATVIESASPYTVIGSIPPQTAACTACHDTDAAIAHANSFVALTGAENCADCHGKAHQWGYDIVHFVD